MYEFDLTTIYSNNFLFDYFTETVWPMLEPVFWVLNILGVLLVVYMFYRYIDARKQLEVLKKELDAKTELQFEWLKHRPAKNARWERIEKLVSSSNQSDWRVAILEADSILDELLIKAGCSGDDIGERLRSLNEQTFPYLSLAWQVHKLRNVIAHETTYDLQKGETEDTIDGYHLIFKAMGFIG